MQEPDADSVADNDEPQLTNTQKDEEEGHGGDEREYVPESHNSDIIESKRRKLVPPAIKSTPKRKEDPRLDAAFSIIQSIGEKRSVAKSERNECILFGEYVASQLAKFDESTRAHVKHAIGNILFDAEMGKYRMHQAFTSSTSSTSSTPAPSLTPLLLTTESNDYHQHERGRSGHAQLGHFPVQSPSAWRETSTSTVAPSKTQPSAVTPPLLNGQQFETGTSEHSYHYIY